MNVFTRVLQNDSTRHRIVLVTSSAIVVEILRFIVQMIVPISHPLLAVVIDGILFTTVVLAVLFFSRHSPLKTRLIDHSQTEEALRESENNYRTLMDSGLALIWLAGTDKLCIYFNRVWLEFTGRTLKQEMGNGWAEGVHHDDLDRCFKIYSGSFDRRESFIMEYRLRRFDGEFRWIIDQGSPRYDSNGEFSGYIGHCIDITDRKNAEELLRASSDKFKALFETMTEGVALHEMIYDGERAVDYRILDINPAYERHTGLPQNKARGLLASELYGAGVPPYFDEFARVAFSRIPITFETYFPPLERHFRISAFSPEQGYFATVFEDITEQKKIHERLEKVAGDLKRSNVELEQFAYIASHDLQEPLRMISSYTQLLAKRYKDKLDQDANDFIGFAVDGANRMQKMIQSFLVYSRTTRDASPLQTVNCNDVLASAVQNLQLRIEETGTEIRSDTLPIIVGYPELLLQLFQNLIGNAIKFRNGTAPVITIGVRNNEIQWIFSVKDNGIGIDPQYFEKIFVIFQRLHSQAEYSGTGIGLSLCKNIVERHQGTIWVESEPGNGSAFYFTISSQLKAAIV
jgi:PAS domain S-box-containing protein